MKNPKSSRSACKNCPKSKLSDPDRLDLATKNAPSPADLCNKSLPITASSTQRLCFFGCDIKNLVLLQYVVTAIQTAERTVEIVLIIPCGTHGKSRGVRCAARAVHVFESVSYGPCWTGPLVFPILLEIAGRDASITLRQ
jgi:hypothetical protein